MKKAVMLSICGKQSYMDQEPEVIELVTEGTIEQTGSGWEIVYQESDLTGLAGVTTSFLMEPGKITLTRTGPLKSQMVFQEGVTHDSLYKMEFGALLLTVCAKKIQFDICEAGGTVDLSYHIEIEHSNAGLIDYHLQITPKL